MQEQQAFAESTVDLRPMRTIRGTGVHMGWLASLLLVLLWLALLKGPSPVRGSEAGEIRLPPCHSSELEFLGKCFCKPGYYRASTGAGADAGKGDQQDSVGDAGGAGGEGDTFSATCSEPLLHHGDCECHPELTEPEQREAFLLDQKWEHKKGYRCTALCRYSAEAGVITSIDQEWHENQVWRQMPFYTQELTATSRGRQSRTHMRIRLDEFYEGFRGFQGINGTDLGRVVEFGAGGYTQTRNILERTTAELQSVLLVDPQIHDYQKIPASSYADGSTLTVAGREGRRYPVTLSNSTVEAFGQLVEHEAAFDTVVMMNVLVYAKDALAFLRTLHRSLKVGGTLIFHDRWFEDAANSSHCKFVGFAMHIIQVRKALLKHFLDSSFSVEGGPLVSTKQTQGQVDRSRDWCKWKDDEMGYFVIVKKLR